MILSLLFVFVISFFCINIIDVKANRILLPYINSEVERLVSNIVNDSINKELKDIDINDILVDHDTSISYNTIKISEIENNIDKALHRELMKIDNGNINDYFIPNRIKKSKFKNIKNGILCDISIGSIRNSVLFANVGPTIPIKLLFSGELKSNIDIDEKEYGINNAIIKMYYTVEIQEQITMPITSKKKKIIVKRPLVVDIIKGKTPDYYAGYSK